MHTLVSSWHVRSFRTLKYFSAKIHSRSEEVGTEFVISMVSDIDLYLATVWFTHWYWWSVDTWRKSVTVHSRSISKISKYIGEISYSNDIYYQCGKWITFIQSSETQSNAWHFCKDFIRFATHCCCCFFFQILPEQVVLSHSPLKLYTEFHKKHCLISGQGPISDIAKNLGFTKVTTIEELSDAFPNLDMVDHKKRRGFVWQSLKKD